MKTAMQELIEDMRLELDKSLLLKFNTEKFIPFLEKEKEQICNAYTDGLEGPYIGAEEYYNQTYNKNK
jgi:hypothetical protein